VRKKRHRKDEFIEIVVIPAKEPETELTSKGEMSGAFFCKRSCESCTYKKVQFKDKRLKSAMKKGAETTKLSEEISKLAADT